MFQNIKIHQVTGGTPRVGVRVNQHPPLVFRVFTHKGKNRKALNHKNLIST